MSILRRNMKIRLLPEKQAPQRVSSTSRDVGLHKTDGLSSFLWPLIKLAPQAMNRRRKLPVSKWENSLPRIEYNTQAEIVTDYARQLP